MNVRSQLQEPPVTPFERAHDRLIDALAACEREDGDGCLDAILKAKTVLETRQQFKDGRKGGA